MYMIMGTLDHALPKPAIYAATDRVMICTHITITHVAGPHSPSATLLDQEVPARARDRGVQEVPTAQQSFSVILSAVLRCVSAAGHTNLVLHAAAVG